MTREERAQKYIHQANIKFNGKFIYYADTYIDIKSPMKMKCPIHGVFYQSMENHLKSEFGCIKCSYDDRKKPHKTTAEYLQEVVIKRNGKPRYNEDKVVYKGAKEKITLICPKHGEFKIIADDYLNGKGCHKCYYENNVISLDEIKRRIKEKFGDKYFYPYIDSEYKDTKSKITVICPIHGESKQTVRSHLNGYGCPMCANIQKALSHTDNNEKFLNKVNKKFGKNRYTYLSLYKGTYQNIDVKCNICGRIFSVTPNAHLQGIGCPYCKQSHIEKEIENIFEELNIKFEYEKKFEWLDYKSLDFYLPDYNIAIECQGEQHFKPIEYFGGDERFRDDIKRDKEKNRLCKDNNIDLIYYFDVKYLTLASKYEIYNNTTCINNINALRELFIIK